MFDLTPLGMGSGAFHDGTGRVQLTLPMKVIFLDTIFTYLHIVTTKNATNILYFVALFIGLGGSKGFKCV